MTVTQKHPRVILLSKRDRFSREAQKNCAAAFDAVEIYEGAVGDPEPAALSSCEGATVISFLSPWIVRKATLDQAEIAINFHPASTDYPGSGCYNFALYEAAPEYGATCHHMLPKVDTGAVILERRFPVRENDTVETLKLTTMETMLAMFREIIATLAAGEPLPAADTHWTRKPFTFRQMEDLKVIVPAMPPAEISRRVRATVYPGYPGPVMRFADGRSRAFPVPQREALA